MKVVTKKRVEEIEGALARLFDLGARHSAVTDQHQQILKRGFVGRLRWLFTGR